MAQASKSPSQPVTRAPALRLNSGSGRHCTSAHAAIRPETPSSVATMGSRALSGIGTCPSLVGGGSRASMR